MAGGALALLVLTLILSHFRREESAAEQRALQARRVELIDRIRVNLVSAAEAEKSAVLAITDEESRKFADQARALSATAEEGRRELAGMLEAQGSARERELLQQFAAAFADVQRIDADLLDLAIKNTNLKAYDLAYGPAAGALREMTDALDRVVSTGPEAARARVTPLALGAEVAALRLQTLLPPHIAEESDQRMNEMETAMARESDDVRGKLAALSAVPEIAGSQDLRAAAGAWARYGDLETRILALSRENTNVRSLTISLNRKRTATVAAEEALAALRQAVDEEPIAGVTYGQPAKPR
ncbi:MAG TPA: hypothetical protein VGK30_11595 [Candidatus Binatia bacterium]